MKVEALMTKNVKTCGPHDSLQAAAQIMWDRDCGCVPVVDAERRILGMVTDRDVCMAAMLGGKPLRDIPVARAMSHDVWACRPDDSIEKAENLLENRQIRRLPVTDGNGHLLGIISLNDIAREARREMLSGLAGVSAEGLAEALAAVGTPRGQLPAVVHAGNGNGAMHVRKADLRFDVLSRPRL